MRTLSQPVLRLRILETLLFAKSEIPLLGRSTEQLMDQFWVCTFLSEMETQLVHLQNEGHIELREPDLFTITGKGLRHYQSLKEESIAAAVHQMKEKSPESRTLYELLKVKPNDDFDTIRQGWLKLAKRYHPEVPKTGNPDMFYLVTDAWMILCKKEFRALYDRRFIHEI